jgi:hypothetical protein
MGLRARISTRASAAMVFFHRHSFSRIVPLQPRGADISGQVLPVNASEPAR